MNNARTLTQKTYCRKVLHNFFFIQRRRWEGCTHCRKIAKGWWDLENHHTLSHGRSWDNWVRLHTHTAGTNCHLHQTRQLCHHKRNTPVLQHTQTIFQRYIEFNNCTTMKWILPSLSCPVFQSWNVPANAAFRLNASGNQSNSPRRVFAGPPRIKAQHDRWLQLWSCPCGLNPYAYWKYLHALFKFIGPTNPWFGCWRNAFICGIQNNWAYKH